MRANKKMNLPGGRPLLLYSLPELYGMEDQIVEVNMDEVYECKVECTYKGHYPCDCDIFEVSCILMDENGWQTPKNGYEAAQLYINLRNQLQNDLGM